MLLFHQHEFRRNFEFLYASCNQRSTTKRSQQRVGYVAVLLAACAISLQYIDSAQKEALLILGVDADVFKDKILITLRLRLLDILALGSLQAVQTCVLLGSYYLYHGEPELAWPLCGCGLRIAQALNLHRKPHLRDSRFDDYDQPSAAARNRCWWAVYEIETFCSMMFGFPTSISDSDCDIEQLDIHDASSGSVTESNRNDRTTLLTYKHSMSRLSRIIKSVLTDLYGTHRNLDRQKRPILNRRSRVSNLVAKVADLNTELEKWHKTVPSRLRMEDLIDFQKEGHGGSLPSDLGPNGDIAFEEQLFRLQALALKLAYENARILIHRPLLSYQTKTPRETVSTTTDHLDPFEHSITECRAAATQISRIGQASIFKDLSKTYAVSFVALHLLTAGVTLCIMASLDPLGSKAHEAKVGVRRLMSIQTTLKHKSTAAAQGVQILRNLMSLVMAKEIHDMFDIHEPGPENTDISDQAPTRDSPPRDNTTREQPMTLFDSSRPDETSILQPAIVMNNSAPGTTNTAGTDGQDSMQDNLFDDALLDFCENPVMADTLLSFEQGMSLLL